jgi:hypothetical protein
LKRFIVAAGMWLMMVGMAAAQTCPALVTAVSPSATSCWPTNITSGTTIPDTIDSNAGTLSGAYTLNQNGGLACNNSVTGCSITTNQTYSNPQPMTVYADFAGTSGGILQLGPTSSISATPGYVLFLDNHGKLNFGAMNQGSPEVLQTPQPYADGNEHKAVISVGPAGMKIYVDGQEVAERNVQLANYASGSWFFGGINTANWPLSPSLQYFNGSLYAFAWWNGTQLTDQQGITATGGNPVVIGNSYCTFTNQIASIDPSQAMAWANKNLTFTTIDQLQIPGGGSDLPIAPSTQVCKTDPQGNVLPGCQVPQGAHVNLSVGNGPPIPMVIPFSTSCDLTAIIMSQTDPPEVVSAVAVAGPLFNGATVTNPAPGTIGTATITSPPSYQVTTGSPLILNLATNGNLQAVTMSASIPITLSGLADGAAFQVDTIENGTGGWSPTFQVENNSACTAASTPWACCTGVGTGTCANQTLVWPGGGSQPNTPSTAANAHNVWDFIVEGSTVVGSVNVSSGVFPLSATANFNGYSGINVGAIDTATITPPAGVSGTATCSSGCSATYTYGVACVGDTGETVPSPPISLVNNATLSASNFNALSWSPETYCYGGYNVYRNGTLLTNVAIGGSNSYSDMGAATTGGQGRAQPNIGVIPATSGGTGFNSVLQIPSCTIYAAPAGTGTACTAAAPCTLAQSMTNAAGVAGAVVCLNNGTYPYVSGNATVNLPAGGSTQQPAWLRPTNLVTVIGPHNTISTPLVKISASGGTSKLGIYPVSGGVANNWVIYGLEVDGSAGTTPTGGIEFGGTSAGGSSHLWVLNNLVHNWGSSGISFTEDDYVTTMGNVVHDTSSADSDCTSAISDFEPLASDHLPGWHNIIADNITYNTTQPGGGCVDGEGVILDDFNHSETNNVPYTADTLVENNVSYNNQGDGIEVFEHGYGTALIRNNSTYHNFTSSNTATQGCTGEIITSSSFGVIASNNITWPNASGNAGHNVGLGVCSSSGGATLIGNMCNTDSGGQNCYWDTSGDPNPSQVNQFNVNPLYLSPSTGNLDLSPTSPAIRSGAPRYGQPLVDVLGYQRTPGQIDLGAYVSATTGLLKPIPKINTETDEPIFTGTQNSLFTTNAGEILNGGADLYGTTGLFPIGTPAAPGIASGFTGGTSFYYYCLAEDKDGIFTLSSSGTGTTGTTGSMWCGPKQGAIAFYLLRNTTGTPPTGTVSALVTGAIPTVNGGPVQLFDSGVSLTSITIPTIDYTGQLVFRGSTSGAVGLVAPATAGSAVAIQLPPGLGAAGTAPINNGSNVLSWNNIIGLFGQNSGLTTGAISTSVTTTVATKALTTPLTGGPFRAIVAYQVPVSQITNPATVECDISDGTFTYADAALTLLTTGSGVVAREDVSTGTFANNTATTFTLGCKSSAATTSVAAGSPVLTIPGTLNVQYVPSN